MFVQIGSDIKYSSMGVQVGMELGVVRRGLIRIPDLRSPYLEAGSYKIITGFLCIINIYLIFST